MVQCVHPLQIISIQVYNLPPIKKSSTSILFPRLRRNHDFKRIRLIFLRQRHAIGHSGYFLLGRQAADVYAQVPEVCNMPSHPCHSLRNNQPHICVAVKLAVLPLIACMPRDVILSVRHLALQAYETCLVMLGQCEICLLYTSPSPRD